MPYKTPRLSKEERKLGRKRKTEEKKRIFLLDFLEREIRFGNVTRRRHEKSWRELVSGIALANIREDLEYTWQTFDWTLDVKDCTIAALMDELNEANDQYFMNIQNYNSQIDLMLHQLNDALKFLHEEYSTSLRRVKSFYQNQEDACNKNFEEQQDTLKTLLYKMSCRQTEDLKDVMAHYFCLVESLTFKAHDQEKLEEALETKIEKLWTKSNQTVEKYFKKHEQSLHDSQKNRTALEISENTTKQNLKKIIYLVDLVKKLQAKLKFLRNTEGSNLKRLMKTHKEFSNILFILKNKTFRDTQVDGAKKKLLISNSLNTLEYFRGIVRKGERILKTMKCNRRYETSLEKVFAFPTGMFMHKVHYHNDNIHTQEMINLEEKLGLFYQKIAEADASRVALLEEKKVLQLERIIIGREFEKLCGCLVCPAKQIKLEMKKQEFRMFDLSKRTDWTLYYEWKQQKKIDRMLDRESDLRIGMEEVTADTSVDVDRSLNNIKE